MLIDAMRIKVPWRLLHRIYIWNQPLIPCESIWQSSHKSCVDGILNWVACDILDDVFEEYDK